MDTPNPPIEMDWSAKVTPPLAQGDCGKDWAQVAIGAVESLYAIKNSRLTSLSVQQLI